MQCTEAHLLSEVFEKLHESFGAPPDITTLRVNTIRHKIEDAVAIVFEVASRVSNYTVS